MGSKFQKKLNNVGDDPLAWDSLKEQWSKKRHSKNVSVIITVKKEESCSSHWNHWC